MKRKKGKPDPGTEAYLHPRFKKWLEKNRFEIILSGKLKCDEKDWDIVAGQKYGSAYRQRKFYFELKGEAGKKSKHKDQHMENALVRAVGQLTIRLQKPTKWYRNFVLVIPESFEKRFKEKIKNSYGWKLLRKKTHLYVWLVNREGKKVKALK